jgi:L-ascorbate metabolism protein UlaG (beta-lactamase superfamily)
MKYFRRFFKFILIGILSLTIFTFIFMQQKSFGRLPSGSRLERIHASPNFRNGSFQNLVETPMMADNVSYVKLMREFFSKGVDREPLNALPAVKYDLKNLQEEPTSVTWFGHSSYFIRMKGKNILVDPVFSRRASPVQYAGVKSFNGTVSYSANDFPQIDIVIISHDHYDHLDYNTIVDLQHKAKLFCTPLGVGSHLEHWGIPANKIREYDWWENEIFGDGLELIATPARHFSGRGFRRNKTLWSSFVLRSSTERIFIGGDSGYDTSFEEIGRKYGPFDMAILECGQYDAKWPFIHMLPEQTVQASVDLKAKVLLPVHWGKFTLALHPWKEPIERAVKHARLLNVKIATPQIGQPLMLNESVPDSVWWNF